MVKPLRIGILSLQGAVQPHEAKIRNLGHEPVQVRREKDLSELSGLILPGGESTTFLYLLDFNQLWEPLRKFARTRPTWGVCAGAILLAERVTGPAQKSLELMQIEAKRNSYGRQQESFESALVPTKNWKGEDTITGVFIRAPRLVNFGSKAKALFTHDSDEVCFEQEHLLASSFHPELTDELVLHDYFINKCKDFAHG